MSYQRWSGWIRKWEESSVTKKEFCKKNNLNYSNFCCAALRHDKKKKTPPKVNPFHAVLPSQPQIKKTHSTRITIADLITIEVFL